MIGGNYSIDKVISLLYRNGGTVSDHVTSHLYFATVSRLGLSSSGMYFPYNDVTINYHSTMHRWRN